MNNRIEGWLRLDHGIESVGKSDIWNDTKIQGRASFWEVFAYLIGFRLGAYDSADGVGGFKEEGEDVGA